ncbi:MAG: exonuclease domain-containing protein [Gemmatimonadota bacterium]
MKLPVQLDRPLAFLDLETTGLRPGSDRIVEIAVIRVSPGGDVTEKVRRFDPGIPIPPDATAVHGITDDDVAGKPPFPARARSLADQLNPCDLAGFNLRRFDLPMLLAEFRRAGVTFDPRSRRLIDVQTIFHREEPRDLSAAARFYLGREHQDAHSALGDIRTTAAVFTAQLEEYEHLPRDLDRLHEYCDEVAPFETAVERWFGSDSDAYVFGRGKHRGRKLEDVARTDPDYLRWMLGAEDMDPDVLDIVRKVMEGS